MLDKIHQHLLLRIIGQQAVQRAKDRWMFRDNQVDLFLDGFGYHFWTDIKGHHDSLEGFV